MIEVVSYPRPVKAESIKLVKIRYLIACLTVAVAGCADDPSDAASPITETEVDLTTMPTDPQFVCELIVSCEDGTAINESANTETGCDILREKGKTFDSPQCAWMFEKKDWM